MATLRIKQRGGEPRFYVRWREGSRFIEKGLGPGWMVPTGHADAKRNAAGDEIGERVGDWSERRGRAPDGFLTPRTALTLVTEARARHERESVANADLTPAQRRAQRLREQIAKLEAEVERLEGDQAPTFTDAAERWFAHRRDVKRLKVSSLRDYRQSLDARILPVLGEVKLRKLDPADLIAFRDSLASETKTNAEGQKVRSVTARTVNKYLTLVDGILRHACRPEALGGFGLESNPASEVEKITDRRVDQTDYLTPHEIVLVSDALSRGAHRGADASDDTDAAMQHVENVRDAAAVLVAGFAGLRLGELIGLRWGDVSVSEARIRVRRSVTRGVEDTPKGKRARDVPMAEPVGRALAKLDGAIREHAETAGIPAALGADDYVFSAIAGGRLDADNLTKRYRAACKAIGLREVRFHGLRHSFTTAAREGFAPDRVQQFAGHEDAATAQRYAHPRSRATDAKVLSETLAREIAASRPRAA